ncbi:Transcriptional regulator [Phytobacter diazotrophicus]
MLKRQIAETVLIEMARQQGHELNGQERLIIRTRLSSALSAKERYRQRMDAKPYQWHKPRAPRG